VRVQVEYKKEYEKNKGNVISVADDPSLQHARQAGVNASSYSYTSAARPQPAANSANNNYNDYDENGIKILKVSESKNKPTLNCEA
jgi:hypothetical protein